MMNAIEDVLTIVVVIGGLAFVSLLAYFYHQEAVLKHQETVLKIEACKASQNVTECLKELK
jgi:hypothetical protein